MSKNIALILGVTGQVGKLVAEHLKKEKNVSLRVTSRKKSQLESLKSEYGDAIYLDLDDPRSFDAALVGVKSLFLLTGYSVSMLVQSKAMVDAAKRAGVAHFVHLGVFTPDPNCYDPHFAWHQMVEVYIKASGLAYTFLHPNCFLQNFTGFYGMAKKGRIRFYAGDKKLGWIALEDVGEACAKIIAEGPSIHGGKDYWFSSESLNIHEVAQVFSQVTGKPFVADARAPEEFIKDMGQDRATIDPYFFGVEECCKQIVDGRMAYIGDVRDDLPQLLGRKGLTVKQWAELHKAELVALS